MCFEHVERKKEKSTDVNQPKRNSINIKVYLRNENKEIKTYITTLVDLS